MSGALLLGAVLTFSGVDGTRLQLSVVLSEPASILLAWGSAKPETHPPSVFHRFTDLPMPTSAPLRYVLTVPGGAQLEEVIKPWPTSAPLRVALYGDSRDGTEAHRRLVDQMLKHDPHVIVHTGDVVHQANDLDGWAKHLAASMPLSSRVPVILALGNHEILGDEAFGLEQAMLRVPPPKDPLAEKFGVAPESFHVTVAGHLFISLNSNASLAHDAKGLRFMEAALAEGRNARSKFVALHHGPLSSGPHGGHEDGSAMLEVAEKGGLTAFLAGHDHIYERIWSHNVWCLISGGGGAPLYKHTHSVPGSRKFLSTNNWVLLWLGEKEQRARAFGLDGTLLDEVDLLRSGADGELGDDGLETGGAADAASSTDAVRLAEAMRSAEAARSADALPIVDAGLTAQVAGRAENERAVNRLWLTAGVALFAAGLVWTALRMIRGSRT
ncbi:MAG: metallophosphoesterase [Deltaproteobacteria bacterium]|nr:metallophosphoesterase [Deltaproteobacteria bacterium]